MVDGAHKLVGLRKAVVVVTVGPPLPERNAIGVVLPVATGCLSVSQLLAVGRGGAVCGRLRGLSLFKNPIHTDLLKVLMLISLSLWDFLG